MDRQEQLEKTNDIRAFRAEDMYFHSIFYDGANKGYCNDILAANSGHYRRIQMLAMADSGIETGVVKQHREMVDAILAKDSEQLHRVLNHHLNRLISKERPLVSKYPDLFDRENKEIRRESDELGIDFLVDTKLKYHA